METPLTKRYGVWAQWSPDHSYLYWAEKDGQWVWVSCIRAIWELPLSQTQTPDESRIEPNGRTLGMVWA